MRVILKNKLTHESAYAKHALMLFSALHLSYILLLGDSLLDWSLNHNRRSPEINSS